MDPKRIPLRALVIGLLLLAVVPLSAGAGIAPMMVESEPNDFPSQAGAMADNHIEGTVRSGTDMDDVFVRTLEPGDRLEARLVYDWSSATPADVSLNLFGTGTDDLFDPGPIEYSGTYGNGVTAQFIRHRVSPTNWPSQPFYVDVYAADTLGQTVPYELDYSVNGDVPISGVERYWGDTRYGTALDTSYRTFDKSSCTEVVIATGQDFPDALSASGLAGALSCPLLLTPTAELHGGIPDELARLGVIHVWIVGGANAVSSAVEQDLVDLGFAVDRIAGADRYQTAAWVAEEVISAWGLTFGDTAFVVRGDSFPDALAAAPFSYRQGMPILLTRPASLSSETARVIEDHDIANIYIAGGSSAVSDATESAIRGLNGDTTFVVRYGGDDRYETAAMLATNLVTYNHFNSFEELGVATGRSFPDALAGGAAVGYRNGVMLLTPGDALNIDAEAAMQDMMVAGDDVVVFGGDAAIQTSGAMADVWDVVLALP